MPKTNKTANKIERLKDSVVQLRESLKQFKTDHIQARECAIFLLNQVITDLKIFKGAELEVKKKNNTFYEDLQMLNLQVLANLRNTIKALQQSLLIETIEDTELKNSIRKSMKTLSKESVKLDKVILNLNEQATKFGIDLESKQIEVYEEALVIIGKPIQITAILKSNKEVIQKLEDDKPKEELKVELNEEDIIPNSTRNGIATLIKRFRKSSKDNGEIETLNDMLQALENKNDRGFKIYFDFYLEKMYTNNQREFAKTVLKLLLPIDKNYVRNTCKYALNRYSTDRLKEAAAEGYRSKISRQYHYHGFFGKLLGQFGFGSSADHKISAAENLSAYISLGDWNRQLTLKNEEWAAMDDSRLKGIVEFYREVGIFKGTKTFKGTPLESVEDVKEEMFARSALIRVNKEEILKEAGYKPSTLRQLRRN